MVMQDGARAANGENVATAAAPHVKKRGCCAAAHSTPTWVIVVHRNNILAHVKSIAAAGVPYAAERTSNGQGMLPSPTSAFSLDGHRPFSDDAWVLIDLGTVADVGLGGQIEDIDHHRCADTDLTGRSAAGDRHRSEIEAEGLTAQVLAEGESHLDASEIYERGRRQDARLSLSTVYRTLGVLKETGVVRELHLDDEHHHYELSSTDEHSHLVCSGCGRVVEVESARFAEAAAATGQAHGFEVTSAHVELTGYCADCRDQERIQASPENQ